ncbi:hypothetical protein B0H16DRAFT_1467229 [Mycena metata]|uniref:Uncharacterized protein n=1 Tax=Mycena metata TaxID=1033252 RepID=A0AAD7I4X6_9AGAR|nr:hypothetical protein B0H16DRAFT_1467229 [Mycena metata]
MPPSSKRKYTLTNNLLKNLSNLGTSTKRVWAELSPKKLTRLLSPRKRHKENSIAEDSEARLIRNASIDASDASIHTDTFDASATEDPFYASIQSFPIPGLTPECPSAAPAARSFTWKLPKLPKPTVEEVDDEDNISTHTFPSPEPAHQFCSSSGSPSFSAPPPSSSPPPQDLDDPRDFIDIPEHEDELLAISPSHDDNYPRPLAPKGCLCQNFQTTTTQNLPVRTPDT